MKKFIIFLLLIVQNLYTWTSPETLTDSDLESDAQNSCCAVNNNFKAVATWRSTNKSGVEKTRIAVSYYDGSSWTRSWLSIEDSNFSAYNPEVAISDYNNTAIVVWELRNSSTAYYTVQAAFYNGSSWSSAITLSEPSLNTKLPKVAMDENGNAISVWRMQNTTSPYTRSIKANYFNGSSWLLPGDVYHIGDSNGTQPKIAMNSEGNTMVLFEDNSFDYPISSFYNHNLAWASAWSTPQLVNSTSASYYSLAINSDNVSFAIWKNSSDFVQVSAYDPDTTSWGTPESLTSGDTIIWSPNISLNNSEKAIAAWIKCDTNSYVLAANYNGSVWSSSSAVSGAVDPRLAQSYDMLSMDSSGNGIIVWGDTDVRRVAYNSGSWESSAQLSSSAGALATVSMNESGSAVSVWEDTTSGTIQTSLDEQSPPI